MNDINSVFQPHRGPNFDTFPKDMFNLEWHLATCNERVENVYPRIVYQNSKTLFDKLNFFGIKNTSEQKPLEKLSIFDFESICVQEETFRDTSTTTWIVKHVPIPVSKFSNLVEEPTFFCNSYPCQPFAFFIGAPENLASQSKAKLKNVYLDIETTVKIKLGNILQKLSQRQNRRKPAMFDMSPDDCDNEICASTQFLQIQRTKTIDLQESLERYRNVLPVFGFNSAKNDLNLINFYLVPNLVNERDIEHKVIKKVNQFISFKFGDIKLLDIMNSLGGATSLDSFLKAYRTSETKKFSPYEWFDHPDKMHNTEISPYGIFYSKLCSCNTLEAEYTDYVNLFKSGLTAEKTVVKLKLLNPPPTGIGNYQKLKQIWKQEQISSFKDIFAVI